MDNITQGDFLSWKHDRITEIFFAYLKRRRGFHEEALLDDMDDDIMNLKKQIARINLINDILAIELDDMVS